MIWVELQRVQFNCWHRQVLDSSRRFFLKLLIQTTVNEPTESGGKRKVQCLEEKLKCYVITDSAIMGAKDKTAVTREQVITLSTHLISNWKNRQCRITVLQCIVFLAKIFIALRKKETMFCLQSDHCKNTRVYKS